jgi:hypothetical protein
MFASFGDHLASRKNVHFGDEPPYLRRLRAWLMVLQNGMSLVETTQGFPPFRLEHGRGLSITTIFLSVTHFFCAQYLLS